jgi:hypothetical protein
MLRVGHFEGSLVPGKSRKDRLSRALRLKTCASALAEFLTHPHLLLRRVVAASWLDETHSVEPKEVHPREDYRGPMMSQCNR